MKGHCAAGAAAWQLLLPGVGGAAAPAAAASCVGSAAKVARGASEAPVCGHRCLNGQPEPDMADERALLVQQSESATLQAAIICYCA